MKVILTRHVDHNRPGTDVSDLYPPEMLARFVERGKAFVVEEPEPEPQPEPEPAPVKRTTRTRKARK